MDKIKVMHFLSDTNIGGAGKYLITYCKNRDKDKYDVIVALPEGSLLIPELETTGVRIITLNGLKDKSFDIGAIGKLKKIIKEEKPNIVHTHASLSARIAARSLKGCKIIYTRHCDFEPSSMYNNGLVRKLNGWFNKKYADSIIATSEHAKENLVKQGIDESLITTISNGFDGHMIIGAQQRDAIRQKYGITSDEVVIGYLARLVELKGHKYLIDSAKILKEKYKDTKFKVLIMGSGDYEQTLKEYAKQNGVEDIVIFTGFITNTEEMLNIVDIQVNCSYLSETTNLALIEGLSLGIPSVATNIGGNSQIVKDNVNGYVVPIQDPEKMAESIYLITKDPERYSQMKNEAKRIFEEEFNSKVFAKNIEKVYERII
ncbi:MAG: glycosyltransferase [Clostridia bacterium]|nr:glycosyltransferase [Clostridia bacterium]